MYPVIFLHQNPEGKLLFKTASKFSKELATCAWSGVQLGRLFTAIHRQFSDNLSDELKHRINYSNYEELLDYSYRLEPGFNAFIPFIARGQRIVSIGPALSEGFENTDLKGLVLEDFNLPFESVYLHLEKSTWVASSSSGSFPVEGVMVYRLGGLDGKPSMRIMLCPRDWDYREIPVFTPSLIVKGDDFECDCGEMAQRALKTDLLDIESTRLKSDPKAKQTLETVFKIQTENAAIYEKALNLALNAFAFMSGYPEETESAVFSDSAPEKLVRQATTGSPKEKERSLSKLRGLGFLPYFKVGRAMEAELSLSMGLSSKDGVKPHLRRGHWMQQAYGQGRALRKLMWRKPCLVGAQDTQLPVASAVQRL